MSCFPCRLGQAKAQSLGMGSLVLPTSTVVGNEEYLYDSGDGDGDGVLQFLSHASQQACEICI